MADSTEKTPIIKRIKTAIRHKLDQYYIDGFHKLYYNSSDKTWASTYWLGVQVLKCPLDLFIFQEIIFEVKPDLIIETGTWNGGSALFLASICDILKKGKIISIGIEAKPGRPEHERIDYLTGSSLSQNILDRVKTKIQMGDSVLVILDSDHTKQHVLNELQLYSEFVSKGSYLIVEDGNVNGHPVSPSFGDGPFEAVAGFIKDNKQFSIDKSKEKFLLTFNPNGYLRKK